jgi:uroporphyrinogen decarboxylase
LTATSTPKALLQVLQKKAPGRTPLWLMRQAGRYLPEYREVRERHDTLTMFTTPKIAIDITLQPLRRFDLDAAIVYADILLIPHALGQGLRFVKGEGPKFDKTVRSEADLVSVESAARHIPSLIDKMSYLAETVAGVKQGLAPHQTLIGFCGAPWTVASYMIEGGSADGEFFHSKLFMMKHPDLFARLMKVITDISIDYLLMQVNAGAEVVQVFESWGGALSPLQYAEHCQPHTERLVKALEGTVPVIHFVGESAGLLDQVSQVPATAFGVDWRQNLSSVSAHPGFKNSVLQGNMDPLVLHCGFDEIEKHATQALLGGKNHKGGYVFNLGHGLKPTTPVDAVGFLVDLVHQF